MRSHRCRVPAAAERARPEHPPTRRSALSEACFWSGWSASGDRAACEIRRKVDRSSLFSLPTSSDTASSSPFFRRRPANFVRNSKTLAPF